MAWRCLVLIRIPIQEFQNRGCNFDILRDIYDVLKNDDCPVFFAGGCVRDLILGQAPKDIDIFGYCRLDVQFLAQRFENHLTNMKSDEKLSQLPYKPTLLNINNCFLSDKKFINFYNKTKGERYCQFIHYRDYASIEECLDSFDFTITQFAVDFSTDEIVCNPMALSDIQTKKLMTNKITYPIASLKRLLRFTNRGYKICDGNLQDFAIKTSEKIQSGENNEIIYLD